MKNLIQIIFFALIPFLTKAQVNLEQANKLAIFTKVNKDSIKSEADVNSYHLWFPEKGVKVIATFMGNQPVTLEVYDYANDGICSTNWFAVNFVNQVGNVYSGFFSVKYNSANLKKESLKADSIISGLNKVKVGVLIDQKTAQKQMIGQINTWAKIHRTYEEYEKIEDGDWGELKFFMNWSGDITKTNSRGSIKFESSAFILVTNLELKKIVEETKKFPAPQTKKK